MAGALAFAVLSQTAIQQAHAGTVNNFNTSTSLTSSANYSGGTPTNTSDVNLTTTSSNLTITGGSVTMESLSASNTKNYTISNKTTGTTNSTLTLGNSAGFTNANSGVLNDLIYVGGTASVAIFGANQSTGSGTLGITLTSSGNFDVTSTNSSYIGLQITAAISGNYGITKTGSGSLYLGAANSFSGPFAATGGTTALGANGVLGSVSAVSISGTNTYVYSYNVNSTNLINDAAAVTINGSGELDLSAGTETFGSLAGTSSSAILNIGDYTSGGSTYYGGVTVGNSTSTVFSGVISGTHTATASIPYAFTKVGSGTLTLTGANTFTGGTLVSVGTLQLGNGGTTGSLAASSPIAISSGATLAFNRTDSPTQGTDFSSAAITGAGNVVQAGSGNLTFNAANSFSGSFTASAGTTFLNVAGALGGVSAVNIASGATVTSSYTGITNYINPTAALTDNGNLDVSGSNQTVGSLTGTNTGAFLTIGKYGTASGTFTVGDSTTTTFAGVIRDGGTSAGTGSGTFTKQGSGKLTLTGTNTFTGTVNVNAGTLAAAGSGGAAALGTVAAVNVGSGGTLLFGAANQVNASAPVGLGTTGGTGTAVINAANNSQGTTATAGLGALTLLSTANIDFGTVTSTTGNSVTLHFGDSSANAWTGNVVLSILDYAGIVEDRNGVPIAGTSNSDGLLFGSTITGLTATQIGQIQFLNPIGADGTQYMGSFGAAITANGQVFAVVPEPATVFGGLLLVGALGWSQRRRLGGLAGWLRHARPA